MRKQYTAEDRGRLVAELQATGEPVKKVAGRWGISVSSEYLWMKDAPASAPRFAKLVRVPSAAAAELGVQVGAATIRVATGFDAELLRSVVARHCSICLTKTSCSSGASTATRPSARKRASYSSR